ncbi:RNA-directed DNA polymerase from mobile element jockey [Clarias magur]|uniref:RNA-directed DNA polymerase from mobile element jockey n=1 Tax=Clarias magur TaxID=1594786 RepID=A0A8J4UUI2_CLAMG|nr:RNA-directed DNA polymerase from mobile element jockey [Clarias magur]
MLETLLFNIVINAIMRKTFKGQHGVQCDQNDFLTDLMFTDDSSIPADNGIQDDTQFHKQTLTLRDYNVMNIPHPLN